jgi:hypothetical protein
MQSSMTSLIPVPVSLATTSFVVVERRAFIISTRVARGLFRFACYAGLQRIRRSGLQ